MGLQESMNDLYNGMQSILGGPVIGLFTVALFCPRVQSRTAVVAVVVSSAVNLYLVGAHYRWFPTDAWSALLHAYWVSMWVNLAFFATVLVAEAGAAAWRLAHGSASAFRYRPAGGGRPSLGDLDGDGLGAVMAGDIPPLIGPCHHHQLVPVPFLVKSPLSGSSHHHCPILLSAPPTSAALFTIKCPLPCSSWLLHAFLVLSPVILHAVGFESNHAALPR